MKKLVTGIICLLVFTLAGCSNKPTTQTPPRESEQVTSEVQQEPHSPVVSEDSKQGQSEVTTTHEPSVETEVTPSTEPESTYSVDTTPEVAEPTSEVTPSVEPTQEPEQTKEPETTSAPTLTLQPEVTPTSEPSVEPTPSVTSEPEPTPTPDATIEINGGSTTEPKTSETPEPSQGQVQTWKEGQPHSMPKEGDIVIKADGTKVTIKRGIANVLGAGQGVDIWTGYKSVGQINHDYNNGVDSGEDMTVLEKSGVTGEVHTENEWQIIMDATDPNGEYKGDYDGERFNDYWVWFAKANIWIWDLGEDATQPDDTTYESSQSTWVEGQKHTLADMKEGAVVVKADGTKVVLKRDPAFGNVLGAGQGVDIFTGLVNEHGHPVKIGGHVEGYNNGVDSGKDMTLLEKCSKTGEVHTDLEWGLIMEATNPNGEYKGDYDGEVFRTWWEWRANINNWVFKK